jgi:hypothetical protein
MNDVTAARESNDAENEEENEEEGRYMEITKVPRVETHFQWSKGTPWHEIWGSTISDNG